MPSRAPGGRSAAARWSSASVAIGNLQCCRCGVGRHGVNRLITRDVVPAAPQRAQSNAAATAIGRVDVAKQVLVHGHLTARQQWLALKPCELFFEFLNIGKLPIDRREPHVGDLVDLLEAPQCQVADERGADLLAQPVAQLDLDVADRDFQQPGRHRAFVAGPLQAGQQLRALEEFALAGALDHDDGHLLDALVGREPTPATEALTAAADRILAVGNPRLNDAMVRMFTKRADHGLRAICGVSRSRHTLHSACWRLILPRLAPPFPPFWTVSRAPVIAISTQDVHGYSAVPRGLGGTGPTRVRAS